jgi:hypothetical protein
MLVPLPNHLAQGPPLYDVVDSLPFEDTLIEQDATRMKLALYFFKVYEVLD